MFSACGSADNYPLAGMAAASISHSHQVQACSKVDWREAGSSLVSKPDPTAVLLAPKSELECSGSWPVCWGILSPLPDSCPALLSPLQPALHTSGTPSWVASSASHASQPFSQVFQLLCLLSPVVSAITLCLSHPLLGEFSSYCHMVTWNGLRHDIWWVIHTMLHHALSNNCACSSSEYPLAIFYTKPFKKETLRIALVVQNTDFARKITFPVSIYVLNMLIAVTHRTSRGSLHL